MASTDHGGDAGAERTGAERTEPGTPAKRGKLTYEAAGVKYDDIDPLKLDAQRAAADTARHLSEGGRPYREVAESRGESAYVVDVGHDTCVASIVECLGTKVLVADAMAELVGRSFYDAVAQDTIAMAVNDLITVGATPLVVQAYWGASGSEWFHDKQRAQALVRGWKRACDACRVSWGGGETPALQGVVAPGRVDLAASCTGVVRPRSRLTLGDALAPGDAIVILAASGIHANGVSLARSLAERLPEGYLTKVPAWHGGVSGAAEPAPGATTTYGEALLVPTTLYPPVTEALAAAGIVPHYACNITGHGWRKLMRHPKRLTYRVTRVPEKPPVLAFIQRECQLDDREAYGTLNMGAGFALFVAAADADRAVVVAERAGVRAVVAGRVEDGPKRVIIEPLDVTFGEEELRLRS